MMNEVTVSAPGRICLFGEHQDYLGLPVIAAAINLRAVMHAEPIPEPEIIVDKPDIADREIIDLTAPIEYRGPRDYFKSGIRVLQKAGVEFKQGYRVMFTSGIPIGKGCSGSSAMLVAWTGLLSILSGRNGGAVERGEIANLAYRAEVKEFDEPGGMMDHFASAMGGVQLIKTRGEFKADTLPAPAGCSFVLGDSHEQKKTTEILGRVRANVSAGIEYLKNKKPEFDLATADPAWAADALGADVAEPVRRAVLGNIRNRDIRRRALQILSNGNGETPELGALLDEQHAILRDDLGISTPRIEKLIGAAKKAGAAGCKINGSGGGGCMFALCLDDPQKVATAIKTANGSPFLIRIDEGFREEVR
jgi:galactokinase